MIYELKLCSNGNYYVHFNGDLLTDNKGNYITFDSFYKENVEYLVYLLNRPFYILNKKTIENKEYDGVDTSYYYRGLGLLNELKKELLFEHRCDNCQYQSYDWLGDEEYSICTKNNFDGLKQGRCDEWKEME